MASGLVAGCSKSNSKSKSKRNHFPSGRPAGCHDPRPSPRLNPNPNTKDLRWRGRFSKQVGFGDCSFAALATHLCRVCLGFPLFRLFSVFGTRVAQFHSFRLSMCQDSCRKCVSGISERVSTRKKKTKNQLKLNKKPQKIKK